MLTWGHCYGGAAPIRNPKSQWYVPQEMFLKNRFPKFCAGVGYALKFGGIYLDTDIVPLRILPSKLLVQPFTVCESPRDFSRRAIMSLLYVSKLGI